MSAGLDHWMAVSLHSLRAPWQFMPSNCILFQGKFPAPPPTFGSSSKDGLRRKMELEVELAAFVLNPLSKNEQKTIAFLGY